MIAFRKSKDLYSQRQFLRWLLLGCALIIIGFSLAFTYYLAKTVELDEKQRVQDMADAYKTLVSSYNEHEINEALKTTMQNDKIPVFWTSAEHEILDYKNFYREKIIDDSIAFSNYLNKLKGKNQYVLISIPEQDEHQLLFYDASKLLKLIKAYPYLLLALVILFLVIAFIALSFSRTASQNQLWVGMAKETAHQLGTPLSSLSAWAEYLETKLENTEDEFVVDEIKKDLERLNLVADRFSKIGSSPSFTPTDLTHLIEDTVSYMSTRAAKSVVFQVQDLSQQKNLAMINPSLFEWVLENLIKNALDAMKGKGEISITIHSTHDHILVDVRDSGKGIPKNKIKSIFEPGFSTKKRGWGLGLTLTQRIIEKYHNGRIFVHESTPEKGTTFRIQLNK